MRQALSAAQHRPVAKRAGFVTGCNVAVGGKPESEAPASDPVAAALQDTRRRLLQVQRVASMGTWDWDLRTNQVVVSDEMYRICGLPPHAGPESPERFWSVVHRADVPA